MILRKLIKARYVVVYLYLATTVTLILDIFTTLTGCPDNICNVNVQETMRGYCLCMGGSNEYDTVTQGGEVKNVISKITWRKG